MQMQRCPKAGAPTRVVKRTIVEDRAYAPGQRLGQKQNFINIHRLTEMSCVALPVPAQWPPRAAAATSRDEGELMLACNQAEVGCIADL